MQTNKQLIMKYKSIFIVFLALLTASVASAQRTRRNASKANTALVVRNYIDSLRVLRQQLDSVQRVNEA